MVVRPALWAWLVFALLCLVAAPAEAISGADRARVGNTIVPNGSVVPELSAGSTTFKEGNGNTTRIGHNWDQQPSRTTRLNENYRVTVGGNQIDWSRRSLVPPAAIGKAAALALKTLPVVATGVALWDLYDEIRVGRNDAGDGLISDPGGLPVTETSGSFICQYSGVQAQAVSRTAACNALRMGLTGQVIYSGSQGTVTKVYDYCTVSTDTTGVCGRHDFCSGPCWGEPGNSGYGTVATTIYPGGNITSTSCPASVDPFNPAYNVPAGSPVGPDGKCPQARYHWAPISPDLAAAKLESQAPPSAAELPNIAEEALARGQTIEDVAPQDGTGPASVTGSPVTTTTTSPEGTTTTTSTPTTSYTYGGDTIYHNTNVTTYTCAGAGACSSSNATTTTTTTTAPPKPTDDAQDPCKANPDRVGCMKAGTPEAVQLQASSINAGASNDGGWGAGNASCPAPSTVEVLGQAVIIDNTLICQFMSGIRFAIIGVCGVIGAFVFLGGIRQ